MNFSVHQSRRLKTAGMIILAGLILGPLYTLLSDGLENPVGFINALVIGFLIAILISYLELFVFSGGVRHLKFFVVTIMRTVIYLILITFIVFNVLVISRMIQFDRAYINVWKDEEFIHFLVGGDLRNIIIYTLVIAFTINFTRQISRKMGQGVLWSFITGRYYQPREIERIFMFMRIKNSTQIVSKLGRVKFYQFLNDFIYDITPSILIYRGNIYQYVEDEIVVSWGPKGGLKDANCIRTFFDAKYTLQTLKERYYVKYGLVPQVEASFHVGKVIQGEIGAIKSEISFYGDVMNTSSRILGQCDALGKELLVSTHLLLRLRLPDIYKSEICGKINLRGKEEQIELHSIEEKEIKQGI